MLCTMSLYILGVKRNVTCRKYFYFIQNSFFGLISFKVYFNSEIGFQNVIVICSITSTQRCSERHRDPDQKHTIFSILYNGRLARRPTERKCLLTVDDDILLRVGIALNVWVAGMNRFCGCTRRKRRSSRGVVTRGLPVRGRSATLAFAL